MQTAKKNGREYNNEMEKVANELYRVLKPGKFCAILIGDTRRQKMYQPLAYRVMDRFFECRFSAQGRYHQKTIQLQSNGFLG